MKHNPDEQWVRQLQINIANDPENFSDWETTFVDSLGQQCDRLKEKFTLSVKQRGVCDRLTDKDTGGIDV